MLFKNISTDKEFAHLKSSTYYIQVYFAELNYLYDKHNLQY